MPITRVSKSRWEKAQTWELLHWKKEQGLDKNGIRNLLRRAKRHLKYLISKEYGDDWNHWWAEKFEYYIHLPASIEHGIELGCGPYTNIRIIGELRKIRNSICSDPLVVQYASLNGWLSKAHSKKRAILLSHPAEECPYTSNIFDLVVMINVLDHVRDARRCVKEATRITKPGGFLIIGQDLTSPEETPDEIDLDIGHPIRLTHRTLDNWVSENLLPVLHKILPRDEGRNPAAHYGTYILIGQKKKL